MVGQTGCLQGQDRSAVTHPSSSHARRYRRIRESLEGMRRQMGLYSHNILISLAVAVANLIE
ncbi:hypothetical protein J6590_028292 [Homalodisca vitripennis]|nr:hypothetical protein J6590_028292 [Homalodisca vitripennis]